MRSAYSTDGAKERGTVKNRSLFFRAGRILFSISNDRVFDAVAKGGF